MTTHTTEPLCTKQRLALLKTTMLRPDFTDWDRRIFWFLLFERMNRDTGLCATTDRALAEDLGTTTSTIWRAKLKLRENGLLAWTNKSKNRTSFYRFKKTGYCDCAVCSHHDCTRAVTGKPVTAPVQSPQIRITNDMPEWQAWKKHYRASGDHRLALMNSGMFHIFVPSRWPQ
jgi:hypothetical protein